MYMVTSKFLRIQDGGKGRGSRAATWLHLCLDLGQGAQEWTLYLQKGQILGPRAFLEIGLSVSQLHRVLHQAGLPQTHGRGLKGCWRYPATSARMGTQVGPGLCRQTSTPVRCQNKRICKGNRPASASGSVRTEQPLVPGWSV